ncbi:hypothetical protein COY07_01625 [Candidatus Peregrinibacteria bacterium CG_4_10_14_0_2_um_filter_43_11]|nr:MAG: hypothetical protein COY07_01625 [Candidatus Peregrinibacteria bacterium CG_4_10_14_0_2_um_filter_43_11]
MKSLPVTAKTLARAIKILKKGGVIAHPADTCFGLAGDMMNPKVPETIRIIKGRNALKPMSIMLPMGFKKDISNYAIVDEFSQKLIDKLLPGPVTILLPKGPLIPRHYFPETELVGIRIPDDALTQMLLTGFGGALITTSANKAGSDLCHTHEEVLRSVDAFPDMIFEGSIPPESKASTVILPKNGKVEVIREGAFQFLI